MLINYAKGKFFPLLNYYFQCNSFRLRNLQVFTNKENISEFLEFSTVSHRNRMDIFPHSSNLFLISIPKCRAINNKRLHYMVLFFNNIKKHLQNN